MFKSTLAQLIELELEIFFHKTSVRKFCNKYFSRFIFNLSLRYQIDPLRDQVSTAFCSEWIFLHFQFHNRLLWKMSLYTTCVNFFPSLSGEQNVIYSQTLLRIPQPMQEKFFFIHSKAIIKQIFSKKDS
jgi:hypothetical protein